MLIKIAKSMFIGTSITMIYLVVSRTLDYFMEANISNIISLLVTSILNFFLQKKTFLKKAATSHTMFIKYLIAETLIVSFQQFGVSLSLTNKEKILNVIKKFFRGKLGAELYSVIEKEYNTIMRILVACITFILLSFPIRHLWVFRI